jgi:hypothetical protein
MAFSLCDKGKALSLFGGGAGNYSSFILTPPFNKANLEPELSFDLEVALDIDITIYKSKTVQALAS